MTTRLLPLLLLALLQTGCFVSSDDDSGESPLLDAIGGRTVALGSTLIVSVSATDPNNLPVTYSSDGSAGTGTNPFTVGASFTNSTFSWNTTGMTPGDYYVAFTATNSAGHSHSETVLIRVLNDLDSVPYLAGQQVYNLNSCAGSNCHVNEDNNSHPGYMSVRCLSSTVIATTLESGNNAMNPYPDLIASAADLAFYLQRVRPDGCP